MSLSSVPVLIVGAGPVGLALAIDLGWRNLPALLVEKDPPDARKNHPRMDNVGIRTMEFCRRWGIAHDVGHAGFPRDLPISIVYATGVLEHELARDEYPDREHAQPPPFSPERHELCPQNFFDPVLQRAAAAHSGTELRYGQRLVELTLHAGHVEASFEEVASGTYTRVRAQYLAACDGAASTVARLLGQQQSNSTLLSYSTNIFFRAPELTRRTAGRRAYRYILMGETGVWATMVNIDGRDVWRLQLLGDSRWPSWSEEELHTMIRRGIGADIPYTLLSWMPWTRREYVADRFRFGRCFLVGDAAHQLSPTGGYGMNTGIADAVDLSWKLAGVVEGWGGDALLDSYELERRPIAIRNIRQASENLRAMRQVRPQGDCLADGPMGDLARRTTGSTLQQAMRREWHSFGIHLGYQYRGSPLVLEDDEPAPGAEDVAAFAQSARPGSRAPHVWLEEGKSTLDLFGRGFVLLNFGRAGAGDAAFQATARTMGLPLQVHRIDHAAARDAYERRYVLVRPDGHVAWRSDRLPADAVPLLNRVRGAAHATAPQIA